MKITIQNISKGKIKEVEFLGQVRFLYKVKNEGWFLSDEKKAYTDKDFLCKKSTEIKKAIKEKFEVDKLFDVKDYNTILSSSDSNIFVDNGADTRYFVVVKCYSQYAEGITGGSRNISIYSNDGCGFKYKKDAKLKVKELKVDQKSVTTKKDEGYGALGTWYDHNVLSGKEVVEYMKEYNTNWYSFKVVN